MEKRRVLRQGYGESKLCLPRSPVPVPGINTDRGTLFTKLPQLFRIDHPRASSSFPLQPHGLCCHAPGNCLALKPLGSSLRDYRPLSVTRPLSQTLVHKSLPSVAGRPSSNGYTHGHTNGFHAEPGVSGHRAEKRSHLRATPAGEVHDLVCVGFGPASLSIAVALHDALEKGELARSQPSGPKVLFLEKQKRFAWHAGMLLPGAKMQISFIKDMATLRDPRSHFTFLNFLQSQNRLIDFINLNTFLPARSEYEEYLCWCGEHFDEVVRYGQEAVAVSPVATSDGKPVSQFDVSSRNVRTGEITTVRAKNVIMAVGGQPNIPKSLPASHPRILHSSQYAHLVPSILDRRDAPYRVAVVGAGQSAAEIFNNIQTLYPNSQTSLIMRSEFLKPSDDSPFVNSIFNPSYIDDLYPRSSKSRASVLKDARSTNYGVVRLELIEHLYERMYEQRREFGPDERRWPHRILAATDVIGLESDDIDQETMRLRLRSLREPAGDHGDADGFVDGAQSVLEVDLVISATGYQRNSHLTMMEQCGDLLPAVTDASQAKIGDRGVQVARDYSVQFAPGKVAEGSGVWLQGCNEKTHGLSDTLLSVLATRSGEIVESIFATQRRNNKTYQA